MSTGWGIPVSGFTAHWRIPAAPPREDFAGSRLRGILGRALFSEVCPYETARCAQCVAAPYCDYVRVFKPLDAVALPAYVLHNWQFRGNVASVSVLLIGAAHQAAEAWVRGLEKQLPVADWWGQRGMRLLWVNDWHTGKRVFDQGKFVDQARLAVAERFPSVPADPEVFFVTPLLSKHQDADPLRAPLKTRLQRLRNQYGDGEQIDRSAPWSCEVVSKRPVKWVLGPSERPLACHFLRLKLTDVNPEGAALLGAGLWLHAGGQTGLGLGRYRLEIK